MNLLQMKYVVEVERSGSISKAAENLYMGQPNLSRSIKELETELGFELFRRTPQGVLMTRKGETFLREAKEVLAHVNYMEHMFTNQEEKRQEFSISVPRAGYITYAFTNYINKMKEKVSFVVKFRETNTAECIGDVIEGECHMGILRYKSCYEEYFQNYLREKELKYQTLWEYTGYAVMSEYSPLAKKEKVTAEDLASFLCIDHGDEEDFPGKKLDRFRGEEAKEENRQIYIYERGSQWDILCRVNNTYMITSPLPEDMLQPFHLVQRKMMGENSTWKDILIYPKNYHFSELDRMFLKELEAIKKNLNKISFE